MAKAYGDPDVFGGTILHLDSWEASALASLLDESAEGELLMDVLKALKA